ncbi:MAG: hypothetical protein LBR13_07360 [Dysgonamonadaceae bacterium]|nr:hypothetical protein [Dysgonamonadaceae bacterium]
MKKFIFIIATVFMAAVSFAQGEIDAYRLSTTDLQGSARGQAMGGAFGALGGDLTGVAINPAGIGVYRSSEVVANIGGSYYQTDTEWNNEKNSGNGTNLNFQNIGYIGYYSLGGNSALNFGFNFNRLKSFDNKYRISRDMDMSQSLTDYIAYRTNGTSPNIWNITDESIYNEAVPWLGVLAWDGGLINNSQGSNYQSILTSGETVRPDLYVNEKGHISAYDFTVGQNVSNTFYWGVTVSITEIDYSMYSDYTEDFFGGGGFRLENDLITKGSGFQLKTGIILRPFNALRLGLSFHTPTWYTLTDYYQATLTPNGIYIDDQLAGKTGTPSNARTDYDLSTPSTLTLSAALVLGKSFILSSDLEYKGYQFMSLKDYDGRPYSADNEYIDEDFGSSLALRLGAEAKFNPRFAIRLGAAVQNNPYKAEFKDGLREVMTAGTVPQYGIEDFTAYLTSGLGFRFTPRFYMDAALICRLNQGTMYAFSPMPSEGLLSEPADYTSVAFRGLLTLSYRF